MLSASLRGLKEACRTVFEPKQEETLIWMDRLQKLFPSRDKSRRVVEAKVQHELQGFCLPVLMPILDCCFGKNEI